MLVIDSNDILLLIIPFQVRGIPHSRYRGSIDFVYNIGPRFPEPCDYIRSLLVGLELSCVGPAVFSKTLHRTRSPGWNTRGLTRCYKNLPSGVGRMSLELQPPPVTHHLYLTLLSQIPPFLIRALLSGW